MMKRKHEIFAPMKTKNLNWWKRNHEIEKIFALMRKTSISGGEKDIFALMKKKACDRMETSKSPLFDKMPATRAPASSEINYRLELWFLWWGWSIIIKYVKLSNIINIINIIKYQIIGWSCGYFDEDDQLSSNMWSFWWSSSYAHHGHEM